MKSKIIFFVQSLFFIFFITNINAQEYQDLVRYDEEKEMLVFENEETLSKIYDIIDGKLISNKEVSNEFFDEIEDNPALRDFGKSIGFYENSLRYTSLVNEYEQLEKGELPERIKRPRISRIFQCLLNRDYAVQIGDEIVLILPTGRIKLKTYDKDRIKRLVEIYTNLDTVIPSDELISIVEEGGDILLIPNDNCSPNFEFSDFTSTNEVRFTYTGTPSDPATVTFAWDFGDGTPMSLEPNPSHKYGIAKNYNVCLTITQKDKEGKIICTNKICKTLTTKTECTSTFTSSGFLTDLSGKFTFTGKVVSGIKFHWDFGDGTTSTEQNPSHTFASKGPKQVCLTVESPNCTSPSTSCKTILGDVVNTDCVSIFTYTNGTGAPCTICFTPAPTGILTNDPIESYEWTFGDGEKSTESNPCHKYSCNGNKKASLKITTKSGKICTSPQSLVGINVSNCECCQRDVWNEETITYDNNTKKVTCQIDSEQPWFAKNHVEAEMWYYELESNKWKKKKSNLKIDLWGNVLAPSPEGCKCKVPVAVGHQGTTNNTKNQYERKNTNCNFGHKKTTGEWGADFMVNGVQRHRMSSNAVVTCE